MQKDPARGCFFCGGKPRTWEHILPDWLNEALPGWNQSSIHKNDAPDNSLGTYEVKYFPRSMLRQRVKEVCASCNNRWMSGLESAVKPQLIRFMLRMPFILGGEQLRLFVRWAVKTHMMRTEFDRAGFPYPKGQRDVIANDGRVPSEWTIWVGATQHNGVTHRNWSFSVGLSESEVVNISQTTLVIGGLVIIVTYVDHDGFRAAISEWIDGMSHTLGLGLAKLSGESVMLVHQGGPIIHPSVTHDLSGAARAVMGYILEEELPDIPNLSLRQSVTGLSDS